MRMLSSSFVAGLSTCSAAVLSLAAYAAEGPVTIALTATRPAEAGLVLSPGAFDAARKDRPIIYYDAYDVELLLPTRKLAFSAPAKPQTLTIGNRVVTLERDGESLAASIDGRKTALRPAGLGLESLSVPLGGGGGEYVLAFPRAYTYDGALTVFCRAGSMRCGQIDGQPLVLYDDNLDGKYETGGGDALGVGPLGKVTVLAPARPLIPTADAVYKVQQLAADGSSITLAPFTGPTGKLKVQLAAKELECRVVLGGDDGQCAAVVLAGQAPLVLPVGKYRFLYGLLYRPTTRRVAAILTPGSLGFTITSGQELSIMLGDAAQSDLADADQVLARGLDAMLEVDLSPVEAAADAGDFDKAPKLLADLTTRFKDTPSYQATKDWFDSLALRMEFEADPLAAALRAAQAKVLSAVKQSDLPAAKAALPEAQQALAALGDKYAKNPAYQQQKTRIQALARYVADRQPGLKAAYYGYNFSKKTGSEIAEKVFWDVNPQGGARTQFLSARYGGYLLIPRDGSYELSLESENGARMWLDEKMVIDHWKSHNLAEKSVKLDLKAGPHPLKIDYYQGLGGAALHFRWTPPGEHKVAVPPWAFECLREETAPPPGQ